MANLKNNTKDYLIGAGSLLAISGDYFLPDYREVNYNRRIKLNLVARSWVVVGKAMAKYYDKGKSCN